MFTIYNGNLYQVSGNMLVGVNITPTSIKIVKGTEIPISNINTLLTLREVQIKYGVVNGESYNFPVFKKEIETPKPKETPKKITISKKSTGNTTKKKVDKDEPTTKTKKSTGKSK